jgi:THO complex subunit 3
MDPPSTFNPTPLFDARGLVVVITGGGTGIGRAMAAALFHAGAARVYLLGRRADVLAAAAAAIEPPRPGDAAGEAVGGGGGGGGGPGAAVVVPLECDVRSGASVRAAAEAVRARDARADVLVNNAGVPGPDDRALHAAGLGGGAAGVAALSDLLLRNLDGGGWADTFAVNATAVMLVTAAFLPLLEAGNVARGWAAGRLPRSPLGAPPPPPMRRRAPVAGVAADDDRLAQVVTVASIAAFNRHVTAGFAYSASKAAAVHLGKSLAHTLAPWGIRSNVICPGCEFWPGFCRLIG